MDQNERISVVAALAVVAFTICAFVTFIYGGGGVLFYLFAVLAIIVGAYMSYRISQEAKQMAKAPAKKARK